MSIRPVPSTRRSSAPAVAAGAVVGLLLLLVGSGPAAAHGGDGELEVLSVLRDDDQVEVTVRLTYVADGHGVPDATVTATVEGATPAPLEASPGEEGVYVGTLPAEPGAVVRITSVDPAVTAEAEAPSAASSPSSTVSTPPTETTQAETTEAEATTTTAAETTTTTERRGTSEIVERDDDSDSPVLLLAGGTAALGAVAVGVGVVLWRRRGGAGGPDGDGAG